MASWTHIITESQKWTQKPSESCRREQWKNAVRLSFLSTDMLSSQHREHVFLQLRFGKDYRWLRVNDLDDQRLQFYTLALHLSLVAGPMLLPDGDFPERKAMIEIVEFNLQRALAFLR